MNTLKDNLSPAKKWCCVVLFCLAGVACTNSKLVLRPLYNSLDDRFEDRLLEQAELNASQKTAVQDLIDHFHVWHRKTQLDGYALLLEDIVAELRKADDVSAAKLDLWTVVFRDYTQTLASCNPFYASADIIASLDDQQIIDIQRNRKASRDDRRAKRAARRAAKEVDEEELFADSPDERLKQVKRYLGFIGIDLNKSQLADLSDTMKSTIRPDTPYRTLGDTLDKEFEMLLGQRGEKNWQALLISHIDDRRQRVASWRNESRLHNEAIWEAYAARTLQGLEAEQKKVAANYLNGLASTIKALAADKPSFQKSAPGDYRCLGQKTS